MCWNVKILVDQAGCVAEIWPQQFHVVMGYFAKLVVEIGLNGSENS